MAFETTLMVGVHNTKADGSVEYVQPITLAERESISNIAGDFLPTTSESIIQSYSNNDIATTMRRSAHTWTSTHTFNGVCTFVSDIVPNSVNVDLGTTTKPFGVICGTRLDISSTSQFDGNIVMSGGLNIDHSGYNITDFYYSQVSIYRNLVVSGEVFAPAILVGSQASGTFGMGSDAGYLLLKSSSTTGAQMSTTRFRPMGNDIMYLGDASNKWKSLYAVSGSINTSDKRLKTITMDWIDDKLLDAWGSRVKFSTSRWKGTGKRYHFGVMAQDAMQAFLDAGLDWSEYGVFCVGDTDTDRSGWDITDFDSLPDIGVRTDEIQYLELAYQRREIERNRTMLLELVSKT